MLKYVLSIVVTGLVAFVTGLYMPWWGIAIAAFSGQCGHTTETGILFSVRFPGGFSFMGSACLVDRQQKQWYPLSKNCDHTSTGRVFCVTDCYHIRLSVDW